MKLKDFFYDLPEELIAQYPLENRAEARLLILNRSNEEIIHRRFYNLPEFLSKGDVLVLNDTRVFKARILGKKETGARVEVLVISYQGRECTALVSPGRRIKDDTKIIFAEGIYAQVKHKEGGKYYLEFNGDVESVIEYLGTIPLPHYIKRKPEAVDEKEYQTVYARKIGSVAAPTAGLHFTNELLDIIRAKGVEVVYITLHIGPGTFKPIRSENIEEHIMDPEYIEISDETSNIINNARRVIGVGTSVTRCLENVGIRCSDPSRKVIPFAGWADLFIYPGFKFRVIDSLITNFHLPGSTTLLLVCAFGGKDLVFKAYREAIENKYRFLSYGDAMLII
ncbi:MAG: tRNA preQ1(34) S-adenosylmethionine ribosyltransferase-isomerase QueA [candidate division WOR-3 bacterium]|nr:tRNA preQ1(34) S-adenosylmethionine ribosyltransferase-isomerase QueA [candidate division WOR-3 bacterium]